ncbi:hypothetical protein [Saccharomonospora sp. CUA-673]|uniref:hypothetical protein n=1 Tax=Saccharomonospora sp. CUA-673 TaxID=1904969 RepID=UPI0009F939A0|nr:hypothetical protein [Saccharomonospora sp. CUA-673]
MAAGASSPTDAVRTLATSLEDADVAGAMSGLAPSEAALLTDPLEDLVGEYQRLGVFRDDASADDLRGISLTAENLQFDESAEERVNDRVVITKLTGGTLTFTGNADELPLAPEYKDELVGSGNTVETHTVDIAEETDEPIRIAAVQEDGEWYPSLFYTAADAILQQEGAAWPEESVQPQGAGSPEDVVRETVDAAVAGDLERVLALLPPGEMSVLHDAGPLLLEQASDFPGAPGAELTDLQTETSDVEGGTRVTVTAVTVSVDGQTFTVRQDGDCYEAEAQGRTERMCGEDLVGMMASEFRGAMPRQAAEMMGNLAGGVMEQGIGVVTVEVDGEHYLSPVRTVTELGLTVLRSLSREDFEAMTQGGF